MRISESNQIRNLTERKKLIFLHVPKTAGTTLKTIISRQYRRSEIAKCYYHQPGKTLQGAVDRIRGLSSKQAAEVRIIVGHMGYGLHEHLPWPCSYFTILREPVDRVVSSYYQIRRAQVDLLRDEAKRLSLKEFVSRGLLPAMDNGQTRLLSGAAVDEDLLGKKTAYGECTEEMLARAKSNLQQHFVAIGISERFDESLMVFKKVLNWSNIFYVKENVGRNKISRQEISKDTLRCIERYNQLDLELYEFARQMFDEVIRRQGPLFKRRIDSYRLFNRAYGDARRVAGALGRIPALMSKS